jgi:type VI secretion system protein
MKPMLPAASGLSSSRPGRLRTARWWVLLPLAIVLSACAWVGRVSDNLGFGGSEVAWTEMIVIAADNANLNTPIAFDVAVVLEEPILAKLVELPASKWFAARADLAKTFPKGLVYRSWELAPGQTLRIPEGTFGAARVAGVLLFADYLTPGEHRIRVEQLRGRIMVQLGPREFTASALKND